MDKSLNLHSSAMYAQELESIRWDQKGHLGARHRV